jgi:hypothetical protein
MMKPHDQHTRDRTCVGVIRIVAVLVMCCCCSSCVLLLAHSFALLTSHTSHHLSVSHARSRRVMSESHLPMLTCPSILVVLVTKNTLRTQDGREVEGKSSRNKCFTATLKRRNNRFRFQFCTMKFAAVLALLAGSAAAFAPSQQASRSSTSLAAYDDALGVQKPLGFW